MTAEAPTPTASAPSVSTTRTRTSAGLGAKAARRPADCAAATQRQAHHQTLLHPKAVVLQSQARNHGKLTAIKQQARLLAQAQARLPLPTARGLHPIARRKSWERVMKLLPGRILAVHLV